MDKNIADISALHASGGYHEKVNVDVDDTTERKAVDNASLSNGADSITDKTSVSLPSHESGPSFSFEPESTNSDQTKKDNDISAYIPQISTPSLNCTLPSPVQQPSKSFEVLPKKSSFSCLKSRGSDEDDVQTRTKKSVSFPEDESIVSMKVEPFDPWKDAKVVTSGQVILEYRTMCKHSKTKPIESVVKQLQDLPELSSRIATLSLKGIKLDNKACESLESIFRRIRFEVVDFENCGLEEEGATALLEMIEFYQSACKLNISMNPKMGIRGWQTLCRMLRKTPCMCSLDAKRTMLTDQTMPMFGRCLKADPYLRTLHLEGVFLSGRPLLILTTALKYNTILEELFLGDNDLQAPDGVSIGAMLSANRTLQLLDLRNNSFRDGGLVHIANGLADQTNFEVGGVASLVLWNLGVTHESMFGFFNALAKTRTLRSLNLGQNRIGDIGIQKIKPGLIRNRSLRKLGLFNTRLGNEGAVALAEILADSISLTRIDIRENHIQIAGLMAISLALKVNRSLVRIDLDKELRKEPGLETVQQSVLADIYNFCHRNKQDSRESFSRESSTSEDGDSLVGHESSEKDSDEDRVDSPSDSLEDFSRNGRIMSTLQSLAAREEPRNDMKMEDSKNGAKEHGKATAKDQMLNSKRRFKITKIMESKGHSSSSFVKKLANVWNDSTTSASKKEASAMSGSTARETSAESSRKDMLKRQPNIESPSPTEREQVPSPARSRNSELKEFYRRLKEGDINATDASLAEKSNASNDHSIDNHLIDKLPYPGKAQKLNDVIQEKFVTGDGNTVLDGGQTDSVDAVSSSIGKD